MVSWHAATDDVGVAAYEVHRSRTWGFTPSQSTKVATLTGLRHTEVGLAPGTYYYRVIAVDTASQTGPPSEQAEMTVAWWNPIPSAPRDLVAAGDTGKVTLTWSAATDDRPDIRYKIYRGTASGFAIGDATLRARVSEGLTYIDTVPEGTYYYRVVAVDFNNQSGPPSEEVSAAAAAAPHPHASLVAAYGMDEGDGTLIADASGKGNVGTSADTFWSEGKFGKALTFNGTSSWVTVGDSSSLRLTAGMTVEAWINPSTQRGSRAILSKEQTAYLPSYALLSSDGNARSLVGIQTENGWGSTGEDSVIPLIPTNSWSHLAATYDGNALRLFINGVQVHHTSRTGKIRTDGSVLRIGANKTAISSNRTGDYFAGRIDEIRIYNVALNEAQIRADMDAAIN